MLRYRIYTKDKIAWDLDGFEVDKDPSGDPLCNTIRFYYNGEAHNYTGYDVENMYAYQPRAEPPAAPDLSKFFSYGSI
jgi:hypothetical protein